MIRDHLLPCIYIHLFSWVVLGGTPPSWKHVSFDPHIYLLTSNIKRTNLTYPPIQSLQFLLLFRCHQNLSNFHSSLGE
ncbi:hypothetical protein HanRHA438_Chr14g0682761 [Helianthus annuus]|nr:hypothetical protein HanRHA438_Chr14g0682761 [Helianthus annuus]